MRWNLPSERQKSARPAKRLGTDTVRSATTFSVRGTDRIDFPDFYRCGFISSRFTEQLITATVSFAICQSACETKRSQWRWP